MFLSSLYLSTQRSIDGGRAFSTLEIWSCVFQSRVFSPPIVDAELRTHHPAWRGAWTDSRVVDEVG